MSENWLTVLQAQKRIEDAIEHCVITVKHPSAHHHTHVTFIHGENGQLIGGCTAIKRDEIRLWASSVDAAISGYKEFVSASAEINNVVGGSSKDVPSMLDV